MSYHHLTMEDRNVIYRMRFQKYSYAEIARCLGCHRGTIRRECERNAMADGRYEPDPAQTRAHSRRRAHLRRTKTSQDRLMAYVGERLTHYWSPEQIAGRLSLRPPKDLAGLSISHTTIYRWIWADPERAQQFRPFLRIAHKPRRKPYGKPSRRGQILYYTALYWGQEPFMASVRASVGLSGTEVVLGEDMGQTHAFRILEYRGEFYVD
jgi:IS30 family transposase